MISDSAPLSTGRKVFAGLLAVILVFSMVPALFVLPAELILFQPQPYQQALIDQQFYQRYPELLSSVTTSREMLPLPGIGSQDALAFLSPADYQRVVGVVFPEAWVREQGSSLLSQFWAYMNFKTPALKLEVDLKPVKANLRGEGGQNMAAVLLASWPECTAEDLLAMGGNALRGNTEAMPLCRPPQQLMGVMTQGLQAALNGFAEAMPDTTDLAASVPQQDPSWRAALRSYRLLRTLLRVVPLAALALVGLVVLLVLPGLRRVLQWAGLPLLLGGGAGLLTAAVFYLSSSRVFLSLLGVQVQGDIPALLQVMGQAGQQVFQRFALWGGISALAVMVAAVVMLLAANSLQD